LHYPFSKGLTDWIWRHNRYSSYEAEETLRSLAAKDLKIGDLFSTDRTTRRAALKTLSFRLPGRPILKFFYQYFPEARHPRRRRRLSLLHAAVDLRILHRAEGPGGPGRQQA